MIYLIGDSNYNVCKIGFSDSTENRIIQHENNTPFTFNIIKTFEGDRIIERIIHDHLSFAKIKGEWYHLDKIEDFDMSFIKSILIGDIKIYYNLNNGYVFLNSLISEINTQSQLNLNNYYFKFSTWLKSNNQFIQSLGKNAIKHNNWVHPYIAFEIIRNSSTKNKILLYSNLHLLKPIIEIFKKHKKF
jgi:hypothetical protein